jgi:head-tail adaptor
MRKFDKLIELQKVVNTSDGFEHWQTVRKLLAYVNRSSSYEDFGSNSTEDHVANLTFEVRYLPDLEEIAFHTSSYRIVYRGRAYNITDYDDFLETHRTVKLAGTSYGEKV